MKTAEAKAATWQWQLQGLKHRELFAAVGYFTKVVTAGNAAQNAVSTCFATPLAWLANAPVFGRNSASHRVPALVTRWQQLQ